MNLSYRWLGEMVELDGTDAAWIQRQLTFHTAEVEAWHEVGGDLEAVRTARVTAVRPHPNADKLRLCTVDLEDGAAPVEVVCGAPNVARDRVVAYAPAGATLPGGPDGRPFLLEKRAIRGVESSGMICSERELGLGEDHSGIIVCPSGTQVGASFAAALGLCDVVFEVENSSITHRPDLWGHVGFARELGALLGKPLVLPPVLPEGELPKEGEAFPIAIEDERDCRRYVGLVIEGIENGPSPLPLRRRLESLGVRSIDLLVDLTNLVLLEQGQPMHAFNLPDLRGGEIRVRRAREGERIRTLDGVERPLTPEDLVIADAQGPVAIAGVMGGENSEVCADTTAILLESATFDPACVRRTAMRLGLRTEASSRFEKALDPELAMQAALRFGALVRQHVPTARVTRPVTDCYPAPYPPVEVALPYGMVRRRLGLRVADTRARAHLAALGFECTEAKAVLQVRVPSWRATKDVSCAEDLVEEIGRIEGYEKIRSIPPVVTVEPIRPTAARSLERRAGALLSLDLGYAEAKHRSFYGAREQQAIGLADTPHVHVRNPTSEEYDRLVPTTAAHLLNAIATNQRRVTLGRLWESARVFRPRDGGGDGRPDEAPVFGLAVWDHEGDDEPAGSVFLSLVADVRTLLGRLGARGVDLSQGDDAPLRAGYPSPAWLHPGRRATWRTADRVLAMAGEVAPAVRRAFGLLGRAAVAEIDASVLLAALAPNESAYQPVLRYPVVPFDVAVIVPRRTPAGDVERILTQAVAGSMRGLHVFDVYEGKGIPEGHRSLALRCELFDPDATLSPDRADELRQRIVTALSDAGWSVRAG